VNTALEAIAIASAVVGAARVGFWGFLAMALTAVVGRVFGAAIG